MTETEIQRLVVKMNGDSKGYEGMLSKMVELTKSACEKMLAPLTELLVQYNKTVNDVKAGIDRAIKDSGALEESQKKLKDAVHEVNVEFGTAYVQAAHMNEQTEREATVTKNLAKTYGDLGAALGGLKAYYKGSKDDNDSWTLSILKNAAVTGGVFSKILKDVHSGDSWMTTFGQISDNIFGTTFTKNVTTAAERMEEMKKKIKEAGTEIVDMTIALQESMGGIGLEGVDAQMESARAKLAKPGGVRDTLGDAVADQQLTDLKVQLDLKEKITQKVKGQADIDKIRNDLSEKIINYGKTENQLAQGRLLIAELMNGKTEEEAQKAVENLKTMQEELRVLEQEKDLTEQIGRRNEAQEEAAKALKGLSKENLEHGLNPQQKILNDINAELIKSGELTDGQREAYLDYAMEQLKLKDELAARDKIDATFAEANEADRIAGLTDREKAEDQLRTHLVEEGKLTAEQVELEVKRAAAIWDSAKAKNKELADSKEAKAQLKGFDDAATFAGQAVGLSAIEKEMIKYNAALAKRISLTHEDIKAKSDQHRFLLEFNKAQEDGKKLMDEFLTPQEKYLKQLNELSRLRSTLGDKFESTFRQGIAQARDELAKSPLSLEIKAKFGSVDAIRLGTAEGQKQQEEAILKWQMDRESDKLATSFEGPDFAPSGKHLLGTNRFARQRQYGPDRPGDMGPLADDMYPTKLTRRKHVTNFSGEQFQASVEADQKTKLEDDAMETLKQIATNTAPPLVPPTPIQLAEL